MNSDFEKRLQEQPMREIPGHWRARLVAAAPVPPAWWRQWLWPCPQAWAGLAAAWVLILLFHVATPDNPRLARSSSPMTFQSLAMMQRQTLAMEQLLGPLDSGDPPAAPPAEPKPRSEKPRKQLAG
jgi:hypothetical protein